CVGTCIANALRPRTATVTSIAAITRTLGLASIDFITVRLPALWITVNPKSKAVSRRFRAAWVEVSRYRTAVGLSLRQFLAECLARTDGWETSQMHPGRGYERYFAASESTIASKRGSPRNGSQRG